MELLGYKVQQDQNKPTLLPVASVEQTQKAVIDVINAMPKDENTGRFMMYFLRVLDNPSVLESDVSFLDSLDQLRRQSRNLKTNAAWTALVAIGLLLMYLKGWLVGLL